MTQAHVTSKQRPRLVTIAAAARALGVSQKTIRLWVKDGDLAAVRLGAGTHKPIRIPSQALVAHLQPYATEKGESS